MKRLLYAASILLCTIQVQAQTPQSPRRDSSGGIYNNNMPSQTPIRTGDTVTNPLQRRATPNSPINPAQPNTPPVNTGSPVINPGGTSTTPQR